MKKVLTNRRKKVVLESISGEVVSNNKKVIVKGGGGGGVISDGTGVIDQINIDSNIDHEIWIKTEKGSEEFFIINDSKLPLRKGQFITLVKCYTASPEESMIFAVINHNAEKIFYLKGQNDIDKKFNLTFRNIGTYFIIVMAVLFFILLFLLGGILGSIKYDGLHIYFIVAFMIIYLLIFIRSAIFLKRTLNADSEFRVKLDEFIDSFINKIIRA